MAVADALISKLVDLLASNIQHEFRLVTGVEEEVKHLTLSLQSIQAVLLDAETRQWKEATVQLWLGRLKHIAYDIDDVVDEWSYEILRSQTENDKNARKPTSEVWCFSLLSACYRFPKVVSRHHIAVKISDLNGRLAVIADEKDRYGLKSLRSNNEQVERRIITTSDIDVSEVKGRDVDKEILVNRLLAESSEKSKLRLIPIVGMGGIGKTTFARLVYNDERVKSHFHKRIWVCVSGSFDEFRIAKEVLEYLEGPTNLVSLPNIMEKIKKSIEGERILVVLDDVWNEDLKKWNQLENCLKGGLAGTCILVTTRNEHVGRIMGCLESDIFRIRLLSEEKSWELFCMIAFSRKSSEERESLEKIGREVVGRCKGLPLAVRAIAGVLQFKESRIEWQSVLDSELWGLMKKECLSMEVNDGGEVIGLEDSSSYLLRHLRISFKWRLRVLDSFYNVKKLHSLHISIPLIDHNPSVELDLGKIFDEFTSLRSLKLRYRGIKEIPCNINKLVHLRELDLSWNYDLAELPDAIWELYNLQILVLEHCDGLSSLKGLERLTNLRHLYHTIRSNFLLPKEMVKLSDLRSLNLLCINVDNEEAFSLKHLKNFNQLRGSLKIRWLRIGDGDVEDAKQAILKDKKHITQLNLSFKYQNKVEELIEALNAPPNLEILTIKSYMGLRIPSWLDSLTVVKIVALSYWEKCDHLPNNLGKLPCLENLQLSGFCSVRKVDLKFLGMDDMSSTKIPLFPGLKSLEFSRFENWEEWNDADEEILIMPSLNILSIFSCQKLKSLPNFILKKPSLKLNIGCCDTLKLS